MNKDTPTNTELSNRVAKLEGENKAFQEEMLARDMAAKKRIAALEAQNRETETTLKQLQTQISSNS